MPITSSSFFLSCHAAFLAILRETHADWHTALAFPGKATDFEDAFTAWMSCLGGTDGPEILGLPGDAVDTGPFGNCPICNTIKECGEPFEGLNLGIHAPAASSNLLR